jgi:hypothetical protein
MERAARACNQGLDFLGSMDNSLENLGRLESRVSLTAVCVSEIQPASARHDGVEDSHGL